jgi:hypothetical protein
MSVVQVRIDRLDSQDAGYEQLLALLSMRRNLESRSSNEPGTTLEAMTIEQTIAKHAPRARTIRGLQELIAALDRRVPRVEREGEISIEHAAAELRIEALKRIEELEPALRSDRLTLPS